MERQIKFVNLLSKEEVLKDIVTARVSPLFSVICLISKQKDASLHLLPKNGNEPPFWKCPSKVKSCLFSEDGKHLLFLLAVNSIHIYKIDEEIVSSTLQIKANALANLLKDYNNLDYCASSKVTALKLRQTELVLEVDGRLVCLTWSFAGADLSVRYSALLPNYIDISLAGFKLFLLEPNSHLNLYNLALGQKHPEVLNLCLANRANADISIGRSFSKFAAHGDGKVIAVVNQDEVVVLFEISDAFEKQDNKPRQGEEMKREKWTWPVGKRKSVGDGKVFPGRVLGQVSPLPGVVVTHLEFSLYGLYVFYSVMGHSSYTNFKVVEESSGQLLCWMDGLVEYSLVSGGRLPLFMSESVLSICLGALSSDPLVSRLCEIIPEFTLKELDKTPIEFGLDNFDVYSEFIRIIFSLHSNSYRSSLKRLIEIWGDEVEAGMIVKKLCERVETLCVVVVEEVRDERIVSFAYLHCVHLLDLTCLAMKSVKARGSVARLETLTCSILVFLLQLYPIVKNRDLLRYEWLVWRSLSEKEVVQEAVVLGTVALALTFFTCECGWQATSAVNRFKDETKEFIVQLISVGDLEKATVALNTMGCDPMEHFRELCLDTNEPLLRDLLACHLRAADKFSEEEEAAWKFCKQVESSLSTFTRSFCSYDHKMVVSASEKATIIMVKLLPFKGSLDLRTVLKQSLDWKKLVITELYFVTGDISLEQQLDKELSWTYLLEKNSLEILLVWLDVSFAEENLKPQPTDYLTKTMVSLFSRWPLSSDMLEKVNSVDCMTTTRDSVLDRAAFHGVFSTSEATNISALVNRLRDSCLLPRISEILTKKMSNVKVEDFYSWILEECSKFEVKLPVITCLREADIAGKLTHDKSFPWLPYWRKFESWDGKDMKLLPELINDASTFISVKEEELPYVKISLALVEKKELVDVIKEEGPESSLLRLPQLDICWQSLQRASAADVTLYDLLAGSRLPVERLFAWQTENTYVTEPHVAESFPHFNHQVMIAKQGYKQNLDYLYYLKQGRPSFACNLLIMDNLKTHRRLSTHMVNRACGLAHGLAIRLWKDDIVGNACVAFIAMLGNIPTANALRLHLAAIAMIADYLPEQEKKYVGSLSYSIVNKDMVQLQEMALLLESATIKRITYNSNANSNQVDKLSQLRQWSVPVSFCYLHGLPLPALLLQQLAEQRDWFHLITCLDLFKYPVEMARKVIEEMGDPVLKAHLARALTRTTLKMATTSPSKSPPRIRLEPNSGIEDQEVNDAFQAYVNNVYTEVHATIQTFTDRNIDLPWSCEQNPDEDVFLTLLKCESLPETGRALLFSSLQLESPILALLSTCYQVDSIVTSLISWLLACLPRSRFSEETQLLQLAFDHNYNSEQTQELLLQFFSNGYFQTFYRGLALFLPDNPLTFVLEAIYRCVVELDGPGALSAMKAFVLEMLHGQGRVRDSVLGTREWLLSTVHGLIKSALTRPDILYSVKIILLKVLADSEITSIDDAYTKFLLWRQVSEILEPTQVRLNFEALYDIQTATAELDRYLEELFVTQDFSAAMEISTLMSANKDRIVVATWEQKFFEAIAVGDVSSRLWVESSAAFKDENVNPTQGAYFFYVIAGQFTKQDSASVKNKFLALKHCIFWRKLVEETLHPTYREESDSIELEMWKCCLTEGFDHSVLAGTSPSEAFSLLVAQWPPPKLWVRVAVDSAPPPERVKALVDSLLDVGDLLSAIRVSAFFSCQSQDLRTVSSCLQVALGELPASELAQYSSLLNSPRKLLTSPLNPPSQVHEVDTSGSAGGDKEPPLVLSLLVRLSASVRHGASLAQRIMVGVRLAYSIDIPFHQLAAETDHLSLLERVVTADCGNKMLVAKDLLTLASLTDTQLARYLAERIISALTAQLQTGMDVPPCLWDVNLDEGFYRIVSLMENPAILGLQLLNSSAQRTFAEDVEILIRAHDCYTVACNVEGIGMVLRRARLLALQILQSHQWRLLVRMLVGIGRYGDMAYIFQMLKDNDQFEYLLRRGVNKAPGLHLALSDFLSRTCPEDHELGKMTAIAFGLHDHQASLWLTEADKIIAQMTPPLKDNSKVRQALTLAMENYSHAAMRYLDAGKMNKSLKIAKQAQVVALQISMLGGPFVLNVNQSQLHTLAMEGLSVANILLLAKARDLQVDWAGIIHERWTLHGDKSLFSDLKTAAILIPSFISYYFNRFEKEQLSLGGRAKDRVKQLSALAPDNSSSLLLK